MHGDIPILHRTVVRKASDANWVNLNGDNSILLLSMADGQPVCFDQDGQQVKLLADAIYGQNLFGNFEHFKQRAGVHIEPGRTAQWSISNACITVFDGAAFQSFNAAYG